MGFTGNKRGIQIAILILVALFVAGGLGWCSKAEGQEREISGLSVGFGGASAGSAMCFGAMLLTQTFAEDDWVAYMATHGSSENCHGEAMVANVGFGLIRTTHLGKWSIGFGGGIFEHGDTAIGPKLGAHVPPRVDEDIQLAAAIMLRRRIGERLEINWLHNSTGGSTKHNRGLNTIAISFRL